MAYTESDEAATAGLQTRRSIYQYLDTEIDWYQWISRHVPIVTDGRVLELGCGTGDLWIVIHDRFDRTRRIVSDISQSMVEAARARLSGLSLDFQLIDYHAIPYKENQFDLVISNHNLGGAKDLDRVLSEISRVLKQNGTLVCTANSRDHLVQLRQLVLPPALNQAWPGDDRDDAFTMETGHAHLAHHFHDTREHLHTGMLRIPDLEPILNYVDTLPFALVREHVDKHRDLIKLTIRKAIEEHGVFTITAASGLFVARHPRST